jgi:homoserine dehydrogenase
VFVEGGAVGELMFYGPGAGGGPTASAVLGDLIDAAGNLHRRTAAPLGSLPRAVIEPPAELSSEYYVHLEVDDRPGVLAAVAGVFGEHGVSIHSMEQEGTEPEERTSSLGFVTYRAREADLSATLADLRELDVVRRVGRTLRLIGS